MNNDQKHYLRLLDTEWNMSQGCMSDLITWDEYSDFNKIGSAIEKILDGKYGWKEVSKWRKNN